METYQAYQSRERGDWGIDSQEHAAELMRRENGVGGFIHSKERTLTDGRIMQLVEV